MERLELKFTYGKENLVFCAQNTTWSDKDGWGKKWQDFACYRDAWNVVEELVTERAQQPKMI